MQSIEQNESMQKIIDLIRGERKLLPKSSELKGDKPNH